MRTNRKVQKKRANAGMKNDAAAKSPRVKARADASKAARSMAKQVRPDMRKSAAKRVEQAMSPTALKRMEAIKTLVQDLIVRVRQNVKEVNKGTRNAEKTRKLFRSMKQMMVEADTNA